LVVAAPEYGVAPTVGSEIRSQLWEQQQGGSTWFVL